MCLGMPAKIIEINGKTAVAEMMGVQREVSVELLEDVKSGDYVLVHAGCAISILDEEEALGTIELFRELKELI